LHRGRILPAGEVLTVVKQGLGSGRRDERFREARADLARRTAELSAEMERLDARAVRLLEQLRPD
jgi:hypothetical protein